MKKRMFSAMFVVMLLAFLLPLEARALGGFIVIEGDDTYHTLFCPEVEGLYIEDMLWFDTSRQAEKAGYAPCTQCDASNGDDYSFDNATTWKSDDNKINAVLEMERLLIVVEAYNAGKEAGSTVPDDYIYGSGNEAFDTGYDYGYDNGYDHGYDDGRISGKEDGYEIGYEEGFDEGAESAKPDLAFLLIGAVVCVSVGYYYGKRKAEGDFSASAAELDKLRSENAILRKSLRMLNAIAKDVGRSPENMLDTLYVSMMMKQGYREDEANYLLSKYKGE